MMSHREHRKRGRLILNQLKTERDIDRVRELLARLKRHNAQPYRKPRFGYTKLTIPKPSWQKRVDYNIEKTGAYLVITRPTKEFSFFVTFKR